jgi:hypothetical protein
MVSTQVHSTAIRRNKAKFYEMETIDWPGKIVRTDGELCRSSSQFYKVLEELLEIL